MPTPTPTPSTSTSTSVKSPIRAVAIHAASALPSGDAEALAKVIQRLLWGGVRVAVLVERGGGEEGADARLLSGSSPSPSSPPPSSTPAAALLVQVKLCPTRARRCWKRALSDAISSLGMPAESVALAVGASRGGSKGDDDKDDDDIDEGRCNYCCTCDPPSETAAGKEDEESPRDPAEAASCELGCPVIFLEQGGKERNNKTSSSKSKRKSSTSMSLTAIERAVAQSHAAAAAPAPAAALLVGVCMRASREEDLLSRGMLPRVFVPPPPEKGREESEGGGGGGGAGGNAAAVVFERVLACELRERCSRSPPLDAILHKVTDELGEEDDDAGDDDEDEDDEEIRRNHPSWPRAARSLAALSLASSSSSSSSSSPSTSGNPVVVVDDVAAVMRLSDRFETAEALLEALGTAADAASPEPSSPSPPPSPTPQQLPLLARPPPSLCVSADEAKALFDPSAARTTAAATTTTTAASAALLLSERGLSFPVIVKPRAACGVPEAHRLAVALDESGLEAALRAVGALAGGEGEGSEGGRGGGDGGDEEPLRRPRKRNLPAGALIQRYVDHGGVVFKVYAAAAATAATDGGVGGGGEKGSGGQRARVFVERRASTPDLGVPPLPPRGSSGGSGGGDDSGPSWLSFDSAVPLSDAVPWPVTRGAAVASAAATAAAGDDDEEGAQRPPSLDLRVAAATAEALLRKLGLSLLGFDVVVERGTGRCFVVDVNYFPSMKGRNTPSGLLADAVAARVARARRKKEEKSGGEVREEERSV